MKVEELIIYGKKYLHSNEVKLLLSNLLNINYLEIYLHLNDKVDNSKVEKYKHEINEIKKGMPIQYVIGEITFYKNKFYINKNVLIPRFETEELVDETIKLSKKIFTEPVDIIDLGTGSGVIGISLEKNLLTKSVDLIDISDHALEVAKINKERLNSNVNIIKNDFLNNINKRYDIIISNPPYIKTNGEIEDIVKNNEPSIALYGGDSGIECYKKILKDVKNNVKDKYLIAFEIGYDEKDDIINLINNYLEDVKIITKKDLSNKDRMIFIIKE